MYTRLNNESLAPAHADTWLLYTRPNNGLSSLTCTNRRDLQIRDQAHDRYQKKLKQRKGGPIRQQPDHLVLLWLSDEGDPYLQTPLMCIQIQVRAYGEQKKAKMISARPMHIIACALLIAGRQTKAQSSSQKPQQLSPRG
jgi:hypothetical protein